MNRTIIVIGAGHGGLRAANLLAKSGFDVTVYEKNDPSTLSYSDTDCVDMKVFQDLGIPVPAGSFKDEVFGFIAPNSEKMISLYAPEETRDWTLYRRTFANELAAAAIASGAKMNWNTKVDSLIFEDAAVKGVVIGGEKIYADLVIDASGCDSPFRKSLPSWLGFADDTNNNERFNVYHAIHDMNEEYRPEPGTAFKTYLKYKGRPGICWVGAEPYGKVNVLCGIIGSMDEQLRDTILAELKADNPIIADTVYCGGEYTVIPVRLPLTCMVAPGYAAVGDSAFMTIPLIGSGMSNSLRAGQMLAEEIIAVGDCNVETLWKYEVRYYKQIGAVCAAIDCVKRGLLATDNDDLREVMDSGVITDEDIKLIFGGGGSVPAPAEMLRRLKILIKTRKGVMKILVSAAKKGVSAMLLINRIPENYNLPEIIAWQQKLLKIVRSV